MAEFHVNGIVLYGAEAKKAAKAVLAKCGL